MHSPKCTDEDCKDKDICLCSYCFIDNCLNVLGHLTSGGRIECKKHHGTGACIFFKDWVQIIKRKEGETIEWIKK